MRLAAKDTRVNAEVAMLFQKKRTKKVPKERSDRQQRIYDALVANPVGVLSTVTPDGDPHGSVIYYVVDSDFVISFLTRAGTRKCDNLRHNPHAMLNVFDPVTQATVQASGTAEEVVDGADANDIALKVFRASRRINRVGLLPINKLEVGSYVAFRIMPVQIRMAVFARPQSGDYEGLFESIESFELTS